MNDEKTEFLIISSKKVAAKIDPPSLIIGDHNIIPSSSACNLGVVIDSHATMEAHITSICKGAYIQLRNIVSTCFYNN